MKLSGLKKSLIVGGVCLVSLVNSACVSLTSQEKATLRELRGYGVDDQEQRIKDPTAAGVLNLLPGIGNFYLGSGTGESSQHMYGVLNFLFWPYSIFWGFPQAMIDAETINKKETASHYLYDPQGKRKLLELRKKYGTEDLY